MADTTEPPVTRYTYTLTIRGNTLDEIGSELGYVANGGFLIASDYGRSDEFTSTGGRETQRCVESNPGMTPDQYAADLEAWFAARKPNR